MRKFINSSDVKTKKEKIDKEKIEKFIDKFNWFIRKGEDSGDGSISMNNGLDKIPTLNDNEFKYTVKLAKKEGLKLINYEK